MLKKACETIKFLIDSNKKTTTISVNFSRLHLNESDFIHNICTIVDSYNIPRSFIEIELTESVMFNNLEALEEVLTKLHEENFTLSMDDFGSGYSSLGLLKNLPVDVIKIDKSFFVNPKDENRTKIVISNIIKMAKELSIQTVAEGVEEKKHIDLLKELECNIVQGYYYSKPVPKEEFLKNYDKLLKSLY